MHEQSETVERDGKFFNVYGVNTPSAGKVLPGEPAYNTLKEAVTAAKNRSEQYGHTHNPEGKQMAKKLTESEIRKLEDKAPTTKTTMGEGKLGSTDYFGFEPEGFDEAGKEAVRPSIIKKAKGGSIRGGGIESRGKTKGRFV